MNSFPELGRAPTFDAVLRAEGRFATDARRVPWRQLLVMMTLSSGTYGLLMGASASLGQMALSAVKIPLLIAASTVICLPSVFVVNTVLGLRQDFGAVLRAVFAAQTTVAITLCALGPFLLLAYASTDDYGLTKAINGGLFLVASIAGQQTLRHHYAALVARNSRHRAGRRVWWFLYVLVTIQMAWVLRPFVGAPGMPLQLFRADAWGNAYIHIFDMVVELLGWR